MFRRFSFFCFRAILAASTMLAPGFSQCLNQTVQCTDCSLNYACPSGGTSSLNVQYLYGFGITGCNVIWTEECDIPVGQYNCHVLDISVNYTNCDGVGTSGDEYLCCQQAE